VLNDDLALDYDIGGLAVSATFLISFVLNVKNDDLQWLWLSGLGTATSAGWQSPPVTFVINVAVLCVRLVQTYRDGFQAKTEPPGSYY
jgi:hypothetical protein